MKFSTKTIIAALAASTAIAMPASRADAATLLFTLSGAAAGSFILDDNPTPCEVDPERSATFETNFEYGGLASPAFVDFYPADMGGGLQLRPVEGTWEGYSAIYNLLGNPLFSGPLEAPHFTPGTYALSFGENQPAEISLVISGLTAPVPEPASWALMIAGFGAIGMAARRKPLAAVSFS